MNKTHTRTRSRERELTLRLIPLTISVACLLATIPAAWATSVRTVCASGCEFQSLQAAADSSEWGDRIEVGPGVYVENVLVRVGLTIRGAGAARTIVDGGSQGVVFRMEGPLAYAVRLENLTIRSDFYGGVLASDGWVSLGGCRVIDEANGGLLHGTRGQVRMTDTSLGGMVGRDWQHERYTRLASESHRSTLQGRNLAFETSTQMALFENATGRGEGAGAMVTLCHVPPGNPGQARTIVVGQTAIPGHLAHGDSLGSCPASCDPSTVSPSCHSPMPYCGDSPLIRVPSIEQGCWSSCVPVTECAVLECTQDIDCNSTFVSCNPYSHQCEPDSFNCDLSGLIADGSGECPYCPDGTVNVAIGHSCAPYCVYPELCGTPGEDPDDDCNSPDGCPP